MNSPVALVIVGCEIGFWILVVTGLAVRYAGAGGVVSEQRRRWSSRVLLLVPLLDLVLVAAVALDLRRGAEVHTVHHLAGLYLGVTVAFGHSMIAWADRKAAALAKAPVPAAPDPGLGKEWRDFLRWLLAAAIALGLLGLLALLVADEQQAEELLAVAPTLGVVTVIWLVAGPVWELGGRGSSKA